MNLSVIYMTIGIPGSGKTTWAKNFIKHRRAMHYISTDDIRIELTGKIQCDPSQNEMIHEEAFKRAKQIIQDPKNYHDGIGPSIIIDSTNVDKEIWEKYRSLNPSLMIAEVFIVKPETALERLKQRDYFVPMEILKMKWDTLTANQKFLHQYFHLIDMGQHPL